MSWYEWIQMLLPGVKARVTRWKLSVCEGAVSFSRAHVELPSDDGTLTVLDRKGDGPSGELGAGNILRERLGNPLDHVVEFGVVARRVKRLLGSVRLAVSTLGAFDAVRAEPEVQAEEPTEREVVPHEVQPATVRVDVADRLESDSVQEHLGDATDAVALAERLVADEGLARFRRRVDDELPVRLVDVGRDFRERLVRRDASRDGQSRRLENLGAHASDSLGRGDAFVGAIVGHVHVCRHTQARVSWGAKYRGTQDATEAAYKPRPDWPARSVRTFRGCQRSLSTPGCRARA